jgi:hypothetical protein
MSGKLVSRSGAAVAALLFAAGGLAAQHRPVMFVGAYGGGYEHVLDLNAAHSADFKPGYSAGITVGEQLTRRVAVHADFTYARNTAQGDSPFAGRDFDWFFYGLHLEAAAPIEGGVTPYAFVGGGAISVRELGSSSPVGTFTKPAALFGVGLFFAVPATRAQFFAEAKNVAFHWDRGGFDRMQWDFGYVAGASYRFTW